MGGQLVLHYAVPPQSRQKREKVVIDIYNLSGRRVRRLMNNVMNPGYYSIAFDNSSFDENVITAGFYICRMSAGEYNTAKRIMFIR
jgi:hypothetical protein